MTDKHIDEDWKRRTQDDKAKDQAGADDPSAEAVPIDFLGFVSLMATQALVHLGLIPHPASGGRKQELGQAQATIDILEMLSEKTKGNLTKEEDESFRQVLNELRMAYVRSVHGPGRETTPPSKP